MRFRIQLSDKGSATGVAAITGLPFPADPSNNPLSAESLGGIYSVDLPENTFSVDGHILGSGTSILLRASVDGGNVIGLNNVHFTNDSQFRSALTYFI